MTRLYTTPYISITREFLDTLGVILPPVSIPVRRKLYPE